MYNSAIPGGSTHGSSKLIEAHKKIVKFFELEFRLPKEAIIVLGVRKNENGWKGLVQVTQVNPYLEMKGFPAIHDKNLYFITLDDDLEVTSFWLKDYLEEED